jgi:outer membrane protein OmpA-like peptidoglycan-associated protein
MKAHRLSLGAMMLFSTFVGVIICTDASAQFLDKATRDSRREEEIKTTSETFSWWPTDAKPAPVKDERGGYWWWPAQPGSVQNLWGNRGYIYVYKLIYDYKDEEAKAQEEPTPAAKVETKASLLIKKILRNVKIYFDYNKADLRDDHYPILERAVKTLAANPGSSILITGNCDARGSEEYNMKLGKKRSDTVKKYMLDNGINEDRIKIVSRGKLDAVAPVKDLMGMQKDRNAQFMIAEVEEVNIPAEQVPPQGAQLEVSDSSAGNKYVMEEKENVESQVKVSTREYTIKEGDSLWKIAQSEMGNGNRWQYLYELNKDRIKNANKLKKGTVIIIPIE